MPSKEGAGADDMTEFNALARRQTTALTGNDSQSELPTFDIANLALFGFIVSILGALTRH
jgi:hypothetical protein